MSQESAYSREDYIRMSVDSGVAPLELRFFPIVNCESGYPVAYRTVTTIHSILLGDLPEPAYLYVSDPRDCGVELLKHNIQHAIEAIRKFEKKERHLLFLSVHCPAELVESENVDLFELISGVLKKNPNLDPQKLCLEFPASVLEKETGRAHTAILDMKVLKVRTAIVGCGAEEFPIAKLLTVPPDFVILDPSATEWAGSRNKPQLLSSLVSYIKSMNIEAIAEGTDEQRRSMRGTECVGFIDREAESISFDEALAQKEGDDQE